MRVGLFKSAELSIVLSIKPLSTNDMWLSFIYRNTPCTYPQQLAIPREITYASQAFLVHHKMQLLSVQS